MGLRRPSAVIRYMSTYVRISTADGEILEKVSIVVPARSPAKKPKKGNMQGDGSKSISPQVKPTAKQRRVLEEDKYAPVSNSK